MHLNQSPTPYTLLADLGSTVQPQEVLEAAAVGTDHILAHDAREQLDAVTCNHTRQITTLQRQA